MSFDTDIDRITFSIWAEEYYRNEHNSRFLFEIGVAVPQIWKLKLNRVHGGFSVNLTLPIEDKVHNMELVHTEDTFGINTSARLTVKIKGDYKLVFDMGWDKAIETLFDLAE